ncbi:hypothetical protein IDM40_27150 [Nocardiopsis sp. HNM0947]|uniref:Modulator of FtsH protease n=1 Tax=Nocardiopsis coralli TaxID=2772213 RepID=A0ABR9PET8_9ACTN|nr:hypothetical protein [Nocardiopsis coralli]MBE3002347.1 hypothetical protein [Nocardiopsis coralli]
MSAAVDTTQWSDFGVAVIGASAALAGLLVVAVSINIQPILANDTLPRRVIVALVSLTTPLVFSVVLLIPETPASVVGSSLLAIGLVCGAILGLATWPSSRPTERTLAEWLIAPVMPAVLLSGSIVLAGVGVLTGSLGGLYWLPVAVIASVVGGLAQAWVLLIEILR